MFRHNKFAITALGTICLSACGDDSPTNPPAVSADAGSDAASSETSVPEEAGSPPKTTCENIATQCADYDDVDGLGNLCLRTADVADVDQCEALSETCLAVCTPNGEPPPVSEAAQDVTAEECDRQVGEPCHPEDFGTGLGPLCHRVGHSGNVTWCSAVYDQCVALCGGAEAHPESDGGHNDAATDAGLLHLTLQFGAVIGDEAFACGREYENVGSANSRVTPQDFRFYVSNIALVDGDGNEVPFTIDDVSPFQGGGVALLDFEDGTGACSNGNSATNTTISGSVPLGVYTGIKFSTSVPESLNHQDPTMLPAPLQAGDMTWGWLYGYKFLKAELLQVLPSIDAAAPGEIPITDAGALRDAGFFDAGVLADASAPMAGAGMLHVGSTLCSNASSADAGDNHGAAPTMSCQRPNRNAITLGDFDPESDIILANVGAMFAGSDLSQMAMCHFGQDACIPMFESVGLSVESGQPIDTQDAFRLQE